MGKRKRTKRLGGERRKPKVALVQRRKGSRRGSDKKIKLVKEHTKRHVERQ